MLSLSDDVTLWDSPNACEIQAKIVKLDRKLAKSGIDKAWWRDQDLHNRRPKEVDVGWSWSKPVGACRVDKFAEAAAVQTSDGVIQGALLYYLDGNSLVAPGNKSVFVHYLATAPWNRDWLVDPPKYRWVGSGLLFRAVCHSWLLGLQGRIVLVAVPSPHAQKFYDKWLFTRFSQDQNGTVEYELETAAAKKWLVQRGIVT